MSAQETDYLLSDAMESLTDIGQTLAAVLAITRRDWLPQEHASGSRDEAALNRACREHPVF